MAETAGPSLLHFSPAGALIFSKSASSITGLAADPDGNLCVSGTALQANYTTKNSLSTCGTAKWPYLYLYLTVYDPAGDVLQSTYLPPGLWSTSRLAAGPGPVVYVASQFNDSYTPTRQIQRASDGPLAITRFSPSTSAATVRLACRQCRQLRFRVRRTR